MYKEAVPQHENWIPLQSGGTSVEMGPSCNKLGGDQKTAIAGLKLSPDNQGVDKCFARCISLNNQKKKMDIMVIEASILEVSTPDERFKLEV